MDRSWMNESRMSLEYEDDVEQFLQFASERGRPNEEGKYYCPCINCLNGRRQLLDDIRDHLLCDGIKKNYTTWIWHGKVTDMQSGSQSESFDVEMGDRLEDMIRDLGQEFFQQAHAPVYEGLQSDSKKPLYAGCKNSLTLLSTVLRIPDSFEEQATQGSFIPHGRQDVLVAVIGRPEHPGRVRAAGAGVTIKQYFGSAPQTSRSSCSLPPDEL
ncbi:hypothetical protein HKD37_19G053423 [Glycine soja]